jgi:thiamine kinase-like enzyme
MISPKEIEMVYRFDRGWALEGATVQRLGGKTNRNYKVGAGNGTWFVRIPYEGAQIVKRQVEARNLQAIKECGQLYDIVPQCVFYVLAGRDVFSPIESGSINLPDGSAVMRYIAGAELNVELLKEAEIQRALIKTLHRFHTSGVCFMNGYMPLRDEAEPYKKQVNRYSFSELLPSNNILEEVLELERIVEKYLIKNCSNDQLSTHNDLNFGNLWLARDGSIKLLDWEYAGHNICGGLYYDYGTLLGENFIAREGRKPITLTVFEEILERAADVYGYEFSKEKVFYCALANVLVTFWWAIMQYFNVPQKEKAHYGLLVPERLSEMRRIFEIVRR